jgi:hypothetical protein
VQQRINALKKWKTEALLQLRILFDKLKNAVPLTDYDEVSRKLNISQMKNNALVEKQIKLNEQVQLLQKEGRKNKEAELNN